MISSLPMRNWNHTDETVCKISVSISSLPMRNWNGRPGPLSSSTGPFPAYLWGIETQKLLQNVFSPVYFQPTYEELKLTDKKAIAAWNGFPAYLWGIETLGAATTACPVPQNFQPTYEELKQQTSELNYTSMVHFQPTYEELKHKTKKEW